MMPRVNLDDGEKDKLEGQFAGFLYSPALFGAPIALLMQWVARRGEGEGVSNAIFFRLERILCTLAPLR